MNVWGGECLGGERLTIKEDGLGTSTRPINATAEGGPRPKLRNNRIGTILVCLFILLTTLSVSGAIIYVVLRSKERTKALQSQEEEKEKLEIDREDVDIGEEIGQGCFGAVFKGTFKDPAQVKANDRVILIREVGVSLTLGQIRSKLSSIWAILLVFVIVLCALSKRRVHWFHVLSSHFTIKAD